MGEWLSSLSLLIKMIIHLLIQEILLHVCFLPRPILGIGNIIKRTTVIKSTYKTASIC